MNAPDPTDYLQDILDNIAKIKLFTDGLNYAVFSQDDMRVYATIRALEIIGEAVKQIPQNLRKKTPANSLARYWQDERQTHSSLFWRQS